MYEICRISVDICESYGMIEKSFFLEAIQSSLEHEPYTGWYSEEPLGESVEEIRDAFIINKRAYYLMAEATGLNRRDAPALFDGYCEEGALEGIWGRDALKQIAEVADRLVNEPHFYPARLNVLPPYSNIRRRTINGNSSASCRWMND